jgi:hypothetical protein
VIAGSLVVAVIAAGALFAIVRMLNGGAQPSRWLRIAPFAICAALSLWIAHRAPRGRRPFSVDFSLAPEDLLRSMSKVPHLVGVAVLVLLAVVAFGERHLFRAFITTMLLSVVWEIEEATVVGHYGRLADLAPNLTGALVAIALVAAIRWFIDRRNSGPTPRRTALRVD